MIKKIFKKIQMHGSSLLKSFSFEIGSRCQFEKVKFLAEKNTIKIGEKVIIFRKTELCATEKFPVKIGSNVFINQQCLIRPGTTIGDNVAIGPKCNLITDGHEIGSPLRRAGNATYSPIEIGNGCWIGAGVTILGGVKIGNGTVVGAGSLVNSNLEPNTLYAGVPAKRIRDLVVES
ncbi:acyltransferase [Fundicoccus sp. Sow4_F4]|uniref:acyltransferase n=1 Tax=Fundicoccus sp. Sow4_F4 TaxID=3438783 RepID=UPI003F90631E